MEAEAPLVRRQRRERSRPARMRDPWAGLDRLRHVRDRAVGHAEQDELRGDIAHAIAQPGGHRRAHAAHADDLNSLEHEKLQFRSGYRATEVYRRPIV